MKLSVIESGSMYTLVKRDVELCPWVVCYAYDSESGSWLSGHYFTNLKDAVDYLYENDPKLHNSMEE